MRNLISKEVNFVSGGEDELVAPVSSFSVNYIYSFEENDPIAPFKVSLNNDAVEFVSSSEEDDIG